MSQKQKSPLSRLLAYAGNYKALTIFELFLSAVAQVAGMVPFISVWLVVRDLISVAPNFSEAHDIIRYGWIAFASATGG
ncbi:MAG: ABC transporter ATP-binding protein, partial [Treponema sp.]|nr:ABC transporter ATP-binding protein [Treponema sp.]